MPNTMELFTMVVTHRYEYPLALPIRIALRLTLVINTAVSALLHFPYVQFENFNADSFVPL